MRGCILVVDDQSGPRQLLAGELARAGYAVVEAGDGIEAWSRFCEDEPDLVITDLVMPRCDGHALLRRIRGRSNVPVLVLSARGARDAAARVLESGADAFLSSGESSLESVVSRAGDAVDRRRAARGAGELERRLPGRSAAIARVRARIAGLASLAHPVLVRGEAGSGRDTVVRALHELGATAGGVLVRVDAVAWDVSRGLPRADAVYLDGVERLAPAAQAFWNDVLGGRLRAGAARVPRVFASAGARFAVASDAVFTSASDAGLAVASDRRPASPGDPARAADDGTPPFHPGLGAVLARFPIELPPLRERPEDVAAIAEAMVARLSAAVGRESRLAADARALLVRHSWRGNARQLERLLERAVAFTTGSHLSAPLLAELLVEHEDELQAIRSRRVHDEREQLLAALRQTGGNVSRTATALGRSRGAIYRLMQRHGVTRADS